MSHAACISRRAFVPTPCSCLTHRQALAIAQVCRHTCKRSVNRQLQPRPVSKPRHVGVTIQSTCSTMAQGRRAAQVAPGQMAGRWKNCGHTSVRHSLPFDLHLHLFRSAASSLREARDICTVSRPSCTIDMDACSAAAIWLRSSDVTQPTECSQPTLALCKSCSTALRCCRVEQRCAPL